MTTTSARTHYSRAVIGTVIGGFIANVLLTTAYVVPVAGSVSTAAIAILAALWVAWIMLLVVSVRARFSERVAKFASTLGGLCVAVGVMGYFLILS